MPLVLGDRPRRPCHVTPYEAGRKGPCEFIWAFFPALAGGPTRVGRPRSDGPRSDVTWILLLAGDRSQGALASSARRSFRCKADLSTATISALPALGAGGGSDSSKAALVHNAIGAREIA